MEVERKEGKMKREVTQRKEHLLFIGKEGVGIIFTEF